MRGFMRHGVPSMLKHGSGAERSRTRPIDGIGQPRVWRYRRVCSFCSFRTCDELRNGVETRRYVIAWFRADLRVRDNPVLLAAIRAGKGHVLPVYCFDPRSFGLTDQAKFPKCAAPRAQFLRECVEDLRNSLRALGSDLIVRHGRPEAVLSELAEQCGCSQVFGSKEVARDETRVEEKLNASLAALENPPELTLRWGASTMFHPDDLPDGVAQLPNAFVRFRRVLERQPPVPMRSPLLPPAKGALQPLPEGVDCGAIPSMDELLKESIPAEAERCFQLDARAALPFRGGETAALARVHYYLWESDRIFKFNYTRRGLRGADYSSKFSAWLAHGCVSARDIGHEIKRYERTRKANLSTQRLVHELMVRDHFRFLAMRVGDALFRLGGPRGRLDFEWKHDRAAFEAWCTGATGYPLVDASMRELHRTGFMSDRGRRSVASFLIKELRIDWRWGAEWFESRLLDYDVHSNYGNWTSAAGLGVDPREELRLNVVKQGRAFDRYGLYAKLWLPELKAIPQGDYFMYEPHRKPAAERATCANLEQYPAPFVERKREPNALTALSARLRESRVREARGAESRRDVWQGRLAAMSKSSITDAELDDLVQSLVVQQSVAQSGRESVDVPRYTYTALGVALVVSVLLLIGAWMKYHRWIRRALESREDSALFPSMRGTTRM
ncbi:Cryptochrome DASH, chloroplastic/mitochondrial [Porphyridium purpureum]|uniref:Cryptochrome DASH n=1 Tax=Porphyridium purpureum TaxID=35688 RepID=A0A5J4YRA5_PORPP|nr:Cryptochrome DASH, chloroplastic/mitochondrial [Porphyridium purpureum]|eukprot:POR9742..scf236_6